MLNDKEKNYLDNLLKNGLPNNIEFIFDLFNNRRVKIGNEKLSESDIMSYCRGIVENSPADSDESPMIKAKQDLKKIDEIHEAQEDRKELLEKLKKFSSLQDAIHEVLHLAPSDYIILSDKLEGALTSQVCKFMKMGYVPLGGISAAAFGASPVGGNRFVQAMVKIPQRQSLPWNNRDE